MILYRSIVNLYVNSAYSNGFKVVLLTAPSTINKEIVLFMLIVCSLVKNKQKNKNKQKKNKNKQKQTKNDKNIY